MPNETPALGPLCSQYAPLRGLSATKALQLLKREVKTLLVKRYRLAHQGTSRPPKPDDHQPGHQQSVPQLCLGFGKDRSNAGRWYQICKTKECRQFDFLPSENDVPTDEIQHLLDMVEEIQELKFLAGLESAKTSQSTPKKRRLPEDSSPSGDLPIATRTRKKQRAPEASSSAINIDSTNERPTGDPPLTADQVQSGELLDLTVPVPIRLLISRENKIRYEVVFPRRDGLYVRFDDWKLLLGTMGLEMGTRFEVLNHQSKEFERSMWSQRHPVTRGTHGLSVFVPMVW